MKNEFTKIKDMFPYRIFQKKEEKKRKYLNLNTFKFYKKREKKPLDICRGLKSVAKSSVIFSDYMNGYKTITQDFCFKSPDNLIYPLRKNQIFLSVASLQDIKQKSRNQKKRPSSSIILGHNKFNEKTCILKKEENNKKRRLRNKNNYLSIDKFNESIDLDNNENIKTMNFDYLLNYVSICHYKNYDNKKSNFNEAKLSSKGILSSDNLKYELNIYSICLKFKLVNKDFQNNNKNNYQKIYLQFKYLPIFYLLDFELFKVFISEIIFYENNNYCMKNINEINKICDKYSKFICSYMNDINANKNDINIYNNEFLYLSDYIWFINNNNQKNSNKIYELKIEFPKIKLNLLEKGTKIKNILKKSLLIQLMQNNFESWDKTVIFELFFIKKVRNIINSLTRTKKIYIKQKIDIFPFYIMENINLNKSFQFFISDIRKKLSRYYLFIPYKMIVIQKKMKYYQEIMLNIMESKILHKYKNIWGITKTLLKCINIEKINDEKNIKISFKFDLLNNISKEISKNYEMDINERKEKDRTKIKINDINIELIDCSLKRIFINNYNHNIYEEKFIEIKKEIIDLILSKENRKNNNNLLFEKLSLNCDYILDENEMDIKIDRKQSGLYKESEKSVKRSLDGSILAKNKNKKSSIFKQNNNANNIKSSENLFNTNNKKRRVLSANLNIMNKNRNNKIKENNKEVKDLLFLTKNLSNNLVEELFNSENESSEEPSYSSRLKYIKSNTSKSLSMIRSRKDLEKNRIMRNYYLVKNDFNFKKLERILSNIKRKKYEENIHNKY